MHLRGLMKSSKKYNLTCPKLRIKKTRILKYGQNNSSLIFFQLDGINLTAGHGNTGVPPWSKCFLKFQLATINLLHDCPQVIMLKIVWVFFFLLKEDTVSKLELCRYSSIKISHCCTTQLKDIDWNVLNNPRTIFWMWYDQDSRLPSPAYTPTKTHTANKNG